ncbi:hypothetical protein, partial [Escherichia coli]|uniref:hypothetical protein n=1 Tax=Escherichia coli TaxID=562 RepID=UPI001BC851DE
TTKWGSITAKINWSGEGNDTTSNKTSNKGAFASSKINSIHISIHIYHSLGDYTSPVIRDQAGG